MPEPKTFRQPGHFTHKTNIEASQTGGRSYAKAQSVPAKTVQLPPRLYSQSGGQGVFVVRLAQ